MKFPRPSTRGDEERILPLINVVFLLLIFFMAAGQLEITDPFKTAPPRSVSQERHDAEALVLTIGAEGRLALDGNVIEAGGLEAARARRLRDDPEVAVLLKADGMTRTGDVADMLELAQRSGVSNLALMTVFEPSGETP